MRLGLLLALAVFVACDAPASDPTPTPAPSGSQRELDRRDGERLIAVASAPRAETDQQPLAELWLFDERREHWSLLARDVRSAALGPRGTFVVDGAAELWRIDAHGRRERWLERAAGKPAPLADGSVVVAQQSGPGETDLVHVDERGRVRALAPAPGPDDSPIALGDGRIVFVSGRTTIASLWLVDLDANAPIQLTNRGLVAGKPLTGFVPPPREVLNASPDELVYDAGQGDVWRVAIPSGHAQKSGGRP